VLDFNDRERKISLTLILTTKIINFYLKWFYLMREVQFRYYFFFLHWKYLKNKYELWKILYFRLILVFRMIFRVFFLKLCICLLRCPDCFISIFGLIIGWKMSFFFNKKAWVLICQPTYCLESRKNQTKYCLILFFSKNSSLPFATKKFKSPSAQLLLNGPDALAWLVRPINTRTHGFFF